MCAQCSAEGSRQPGWGQLCSALRLPSSQGCCHLWLWQTAKCLKCMHSQQRAMLEMQAVRCKRATVWICSGQFQGPKPFFSLWLFLFLFFVRMGPTPVFSVLTHVELIASLCQACAFNPKRYRFHKCVFKASKQFCLGCCLKNQQSAFLSVYREHFCRKGLWPFPR